MSGYDRSLFRPDEGEARVLLRMAVETLTAMPYAEERWSIEEQAALRRAYRRLERDLGAHVYCLTCGADPVAHTDFAHEPNYTTEFGS